MNTYYVTRWALTRGILRVEGEICNDISDDMMVVRNPRGLDVCFHGTEWHSVCSVAETQVGEMIKNEAKRLTRKLKKLSSPKFRDKAFGVSDWPEK